MVSIKAWIDAFRLRTLPLALSSIILGSFLAAYNQQFNLTVCILAVLTTLFLQILSNLANDYGDTVNGVDNAERKGPKRALQQGDITLSQMKMAIIIFVSLSLVTGITLLMFSGAILDKNAFIWMLILGITAIIAALKYTMGKNPYGYAGFGDIFVFIFFGLVGVLGTFYLQTGAVSMKELLPAASIGFFSTGVLNLNNARDRDNDAAFGKRTLAVIMGAAHIKIYHVFLLLAGMLSAIIFSISVSASAWKWIYLLAFIPMIRNALTVFRNQDPMLLDPELKNLALATLFFSVFFGIGLMI